MTLTTASYPTLADWRHSLARVVTDPAELWRRLRLPPELLPGAVRASQAFGLRVPESFIARMRLGDIHDPLLRQVMPLDQERLVAPDFDYDPLLEVSAARLPGLLHKYHGRVLLTMTAACAVNCRYCFRRHFPYTENQPGHDKWQAAIEYIAKDASIAEVILSGGEPLLSSDNQLADFITRLQTVKHVTTLRIHTRMPIVIPERITPGLLELLTNSRLQGVMVLHSNHANEINHEVKKAVSYLRDANVHVLNQAVLLKGVNDTAEALVALSHALFGVGILPYYLHVLDKVQGAAHFLVADEEAVTLWQAMRARLPGYLVPRLVREVAAENSKHWLTALPV